MGETGLSSAVVRGWQLARAPVLGVIDADLQHPPEVCAGCGPRWRAAPTWRVASRHVPGGGVSEWSLRRRILSRGAQLVGLLVLPGLVGARQRSDERLLLRAPGGDRRPSS